MSTKATTLSQDTPALPVSREAGGALVAAPSTPMSLIQRAVESGATMEMLTGLFALQERYEANQARKSFDAAIAAAKCEIPVIVKDRVVDFSTTKGGRTNYAYEDLSTIARVIDPILGRYGLSYRFRTNSGDKTVTVACVISHRDGHSEETSLTGPHDLTGNKNALQAIASSVVYLQRYTLKAALGLAAGNDDDGRGGAKGAPESPGGPGDPPPPRNSKDEVVATVKAMMREEGFDDAQLTNIAAHKAGRPIGHWCRLNEDALHYITTDEGWREMLQIGRELAIEPQPPHP